MEIRTLLIFAAICFCSSEAIALAKCTEETEFKPSICAHRLPPIKHVVIEENGAGKPSDDPREYCPHFRLSESKVKEYFRKGGVLRENTYHSLIMWSPCYATGWIEFADGRTAEWMIRQLGSGRLAFAGRAPEDWYCLSCDDFWGLYPRPASAGKRASQATDG